MESLSFDRMVDVYDETRVFDESCFNAAVGFMVRRYPVDLFNQIFEPGIGSGRIAIPLAERCYQVTGVDIATAMLNHLRKKLERVKSPLPVNFLRADVTSLPFPDGIFNMAVIVHLFYFIQDWKTALSEILRVTRIGGPVIFLHTGNGVEVPFLIQRYRELAFEQGYTISNLGVKSTSEVLDYLRSQRYHVEIVRDRWKWTERISLDKALSYIRDRAYSWTLLTPEKIHNLVIKNLEAEMMERYGTLSQELDVPNEIYLAIAAAHQSY